MRSSIFAMMVAFGTTITMPALAQQSTTTPGQQMQSGQQTQQEADKGIKTRNSGESGYVGDQEKPAASAHPPGQPDSTTGSSSGTASSGGTETPRR